MTAMTAMTTVRAVLTFAFAVHIAAQSGGWAANPEVVRRTAEARPQFNYDEARVGAYTLPDLFGG
jgi:hypothetical protein